MLKLKETQHSYYCSESNYYVNGHQNWGRYEFDDWHSFKLDWLFADGSIDDDLNHLFRFDINKNEETGKWQLWLFFMMQRKGIFVPVLIRGITEEDMPEIEAFLSARWEYMKKQWCEFSEEEQQAALPRWISVEERLPEANTSVLIRARYCNSYKTHIGEITDEGRWVRDFGKRIAKTRISHWMPLPDAPKEGE